jgi:DNA repair exonuclease SbcCD nuclease subunit
MINLVWRTDVHMSDHKPSSRLDDWDDTVLEKLGQVRDIAYTNNAMAILDGGDFFHVKSPTKNSHKLIIKTSEHHIDYKIPVYCCPGNHDSVYGDYKFLPQQPLGVLYATGIFKRLYNEHEVVFEKDGFKVRVVGVPYPGPSYDKSLFEHIKKGNEDILICVAHILASEKGGTMFEGEDIIKYSDLEDLEPDVFCFGHWHKNQGITQVGNKTIINTGSLTRGSLSEDEVNRIPCCVLIECTKEGVVCTQKPLKVKAPEQVFDMEGRRRQVERQMEMDSFVHKLQEQLNTKTEDTLHDSINNLEVSNEVREMVLHYLELGE